MHAIRFHYRPLRYLWTRYAASRHPALALGPLGCVALDDVEPPALPGPDWVRVDTSMSGICGSDLAAVSAHDSFTLEPFGAYPFTFGHENIGRVAALGGAVGSWTVGDRVIVNPMLACAQRGLEPVCAACARGEYGLCRRTTEGALGTGPMIGYCPAVGGGWSRSFVAHTSQLHAAASLHPDIAVLADPLASALRPVLLHPPHADDVVLVIGAGTIGVLTIQALRSSGWAGPIAALGRYDFQLELARAAGADPVFRSHNLLYRWAEALPQARAYRPTLAPRFVEGGPSLVYDTVGSAATIGAALALTREGGRIVLVGAAARVTADWTRLWYRQLSVAGVFAYGRAPAAIPAAAGGGGAAAGGGGAAARPVTGGPAEADTGTADIYELAIAQLRTGAYDRLGLVTHRFGIEEYRAALITAMRKGAPQSTKVVFAFDSP